MYHRFRVWRLLSLTLLPCVLILFYWTTHVSCFCTADRKSQKRRVCVAVCRREKVIFSVPRSFENQDGFPGLKCFSCHNDIFTVFNFVTLLVEFADVSNNNGMLWIHGRHPTIAGSDAILSFCNKDDVSIVVRRVHGLQIQQQSRASGTLTCGSRTKNCAPLKNMVLPEMTPLLAKLFRRMRLTEAHGLD